jgi:asparagine synthase (glutamine-hydrolysing)
MCGIFGFAGTADRAAAFDLDGAISSMRHRGPDGHGTFRDRCADVGVAFAHTRLAIIDLSDAGRQPMSTADGRYTLVFNGEVYNFRSLRQELEREGERFVSQTDSEVVLKAFAAWGSRCVARFRGIFAFAIWDRSEGTLFLARDHLGVKPLYYAHTSDGLAFASEVRTLLRTGAAPRTMSIPGLASYLTYGSLQDPLTIIDGAFALLPGHTATFRSGHLSIDPYWQVSTDREPDLTFEAAIERIRPVLREAVRMQLVADVPLGVFLSGGVDSSAIVALASAASGTPVHTFSVTFDEAAYSEEHWAADVARRFGCDHHRVHLSADRAAREFDRFVDALDQPAADGVNTFFVAEAAREAGLSVALSGTGGDEVFAGYPNFRSFGRLLALGRIARPAARVFSRFTGGFNGTSIRVKKASAILAAGGDPLATYAALRSMFSAKQVRAMTGKEAAPEPPEQNLDASDPIDLYSRLELTHYLRNTLLRDTDVMSMAHSLEVRVPLVDPELVQCLATIPGPRKIGRTSKPLLTEACGSLPEHVGVRPKMGFTLPMDVWFRGPLGQRMSDIFATDGPVDARSARRLWQSYRNGSPSVSWSRVWTVAALLEWSHRNDVALHG